MEDKKFAHGGLVQGKGTELGGEWELTYMGREWLMCKKCKAIFESYPGLNAHECKPLTDIDFRNLTISAPINQETGEPYFVLDQKGWVGQWSKGPTIHIPFPRTLRNRAICFLLNLFETIRKKIQF